MRILVTAPLGYGGISSLMINIQKNIDRDKLNFDYLTLHDRKEPQEDTVISLGSFKYVASGDSTKFKPFRCFKRMNEIRKICKNNHIEVFHYNEGNPKGILNIIAAKAGGVKYVTYHSHNGGTNDQGLLSKMLDFACKMIMPLFCDDYWACSSLAAEFTFPPRIYKKKLFYFMPNAIDLNRYRYAPIFREKYRKELGVENKFVIGHIGRFNRQKNHTFLIDIFAKIHTLDNEAVLVLFGEGETQEKIRKKVENLDLQDCVIFYGATNKMNELYNALDVFLMPSLFEGLPVTGVEAQASGLPIVMSDVITKEVSIAPNVEYLSLNEPVETWADKVLSFKGQSRKDYCDDLREAGFDQIKMVEHFQRYYLELGKKLGID